jgi:hypothetical protein
VQPLRSNFMRPRAFTSMAFVDLFPDPAPPPSIGGNVVLVPVRCCCYTAGSPLGGGVGDS